MCIISMFFVILCRVAVAVLSPARASVRAQIPGWALLYSRMNLATFSGQITTAVS